MMQLPSYKRSLNIPAQNTKDVTGIIFFCFSFYYLISLVFSLSENHIDKLSGII